MKSNHKLGIELINKMIKNGVEQGKIHAGDVSDGYHTFDELYDIRKVYNAALFNEWARTETGHQKEFPKYDVHKALHHHDGELCFGGGWFIVVAILPDGQISNHYKVEDWDLFKIPEASKAKYEFDGHTGQDVLIRLKALINN